MTNGDGARSIGDEGEEVVEGACGDAPLLELCHVTVVRDGRTVLADLSLRLAAHERIAILGRNGAGKSTLLRLLTRECYPVPSARTVFRIMGRDRWNVFALRTLLGIVTSDLGASFEAGTSAREIVLGGFFSSLTVAATQRVTRDMHERAAEALERLGAAHLAPRDVRTLSSGELRRVTIARALVHRPRALVFDEPCASLDLGAQREVRAAMSALAREGTGIVLVTHDLADVVPEIERVALIAEGRIVADGPADRVVTGPALSVLFGCDVDLRIHDGGFDARPARREG